MRHVVPKDFVDKELFRWSVYYREFDYPLYELFERSNDRIEHHPWIAITPLRYAKLTQRISKLEEKEDYVKIELVDGNVVEIYCPILRRVLKTALECKNYHEIESKLKNYMRIHFGEFCISACAWLVSYLIGLEVLDIDYLL